MSLGQMPAAAVMPLSTPSPVRREWAGLGLPESGWVLVTDRALCVRCEDDAAKPCTEACIETHRLPPESRKALGTCSQCDDMPCATVCSVDAIVKTAQGVVEIDQELCIGCRFCEDACPSHALMFVDPYRTPVPALGVPGYDPGQPSGELPYTVAKCTFCAERLLTGRMPVCAETCPAGAIWVGNLDRNTATNGRQVARLSDLLEDRQMELTPPGHRVVSLL